MPSTLAPAIATAAPVAEGALVVPTKTEALVAAARQVRADAAPPTAEGATEEPAEGEEPAAEAAAADPAAEGEAEGEKRLSPDLVAMKRQERKFLEQKQAWEGEKAQYGEQLAAAKEYIGRVDQLAANYLADPVAASHAIAGRVLKPEEHQALAEAHWIQAVGVENAPAEWRDKIGKNAYDQRLAKLEAANEALRGELDTRDENRARQYVEQSYRGELSAALDTAGDTYEHVAAHAGEDRQALIDALFVIADGMADRDNKIPTPGDVIAQLEENIVRELAPYTGRGLYAKQATKKQATPPSGKQARTTTRTLSNTTTPSETGRGRPKAKNEEERIARAAQVFGEMTGQR